MTSTLANQSINWTVIAQELTGIETITDPTQVAKLSSDYYHFSPILQPLLKDKVGDLVVRPSTIAEVLHIAQVCVRHKAPLIVRGAGTGNYGQCIPLHGGLILDLTKMTKINWLQPGLTSVEPGVKLAAFDKQAREMGWEWRMVPSTYRTATIGGFIAGGSGGIGSITYGQLRDRGNIHALKVVTMEDNPRIIELRGDEIQKVNHNYGTNGIIVELEMPLAPALPWAEAIVTFTDFMTAAKFGQALGDADGLVKKLISIHAAPIPSYFVALKNSIPAGCHCALVMIAEFCLEPFQELVKQFGGEITYQKTAKEATKGTSLLEFTWNHTTLHARSVDTTLTYLQTLFPADKTLTLLEHMANHFGEEVMQHLEFIQVQGQTVPAALQVVRYSTEARLKEIIQYHEDMGAFIANPHTYILEDGGMKAIDPRPLEFKKLVDPYGLLNPGKMKAWSTLVP